MTITQIIAALLNEAFWSLSDSNLWYYRQAKFDLLSIVYDYDT